jgi:heat shock protein HslJ
MQPYVGCRQELIVRCRRLVAVATLLRLVVVAALLAGCSGAAAPGLAGRTFVSTGVTAAGVARDLLPGTSIRIVFSDDGSVGVSAGCNLMGGTYRIDGAVLRIEGGAMTEMACDEAREAQDGWLFAFVTAAPTATIDGPNLTLVGGDVVIRLVDREVAEPDLPLVGPTWTVDSIIAGDAVSSVPDGVVATLVFGADGQVRVASGCNQGGGRYVVDGHTIRFTELVQTDMACDGAAGEMEAAVMAVLEADAVTFAIDAAGLTLQAGARGLGLQGS